MKLLRSILIVLLALAIPVAAFAAEVAPVAVEPTMAMPLIAGQFTKPKPGSGTVNEHALVAEMRWAGREKRAIQVAIDSVKPDAKQADVIRIDFTGKGDFKNAATIPLPAPAQGSSQMTSVAFGPVKLDVKVGDRVLPVMVRGTYYKGEYTFNARGTTRRQTFRQVSLFPGAAIEGFCTFGDKSCHVRVMDDNCNLAFGDKCRPMPMGYAGLVTGDRIMVDTGDGTYTGQSATTGYCGQPFLFDGKLYDVALSADGKSISATLLNLPTGTIKMDAASWYCQLVNDQYCLTLNGGKDGAMVPAGKYQFITGTLSPAEGTVIRLSAQRGKSVGVVVEAGKEVTLPVGLPLGARLDARVSGRNVVFSLADMTDRSGCQFTMIVNNRQPPAPKVTVTDSAGKNVYENTLEYG